MAKYGVAIHREGVRSSGPPYYLLTFSLTQYHYYLAASAGPLEP